MKVVFMRHGIEGPATTVGGNRDDVDLTDVGKDEVKLVANGLAALGKKWTAMLVSPALRAQTTGNIVGDKLGLKVDTDNTLAPGCTLIRLAGCLADFQDSDRVLCIGHSPDLDVMAGILISSTAPLAYLMIKRAGVCSIDVPVDAFANANSAGDLIGMGSLHWLMTPKHLILLGGGDPNAQ